MVSINYNHHCYILMIYYIVTDENIENMIAYIFDYNIDWLYLFRWELDDWTYEYRLSFNVQYN